MSGGAAFPTSEPAEATADYQNPSCSQHGGETMSSPKQQQQHQSHQQQGLWMAATPVAKPTDNAAAAADWSSPPPCCLPPIQMGCNKPTIGWGAFYFLCIGVAAFLAISYMITIGLAVSPAMKLKFELHKVGLYLHIFPSAIALILAPFQAHSWLRRWSLSAHRWVGRIYLVLGVLPGSMAGMYLALMAEGGLASELGFGFLACLWFLTAIAGWVAIACFRNVAWHQRFILWNVALTFSAVTLRIYLPLGIMINRGDMITPYRVIAWLCWVPNIPAVELYNFFSAKCASRDADEVAAASTQANA